MEPEAKPDAPHRTLPLEEGENNGDDGEEEEDDDDDEFKSSIEEDDPAGGGDAQEAMPRMDVRASKRSWGARASISRARSEEGPQDGPPKRRRTRDSGKTRVPATPAPILQMVKPKRPLNTVTPRRYTF